MIAKPCMDAYESREAVKSQFKTIIENSKVFAPRETLRCKNLRLKKLSSEQAKKKKEEQPRVF